MKVFEIFKSISGEVAGCPQGSLATFIRFSGCNMKPFCKFCDAKETQSGEVTDEVSIQEIVDTVNEYGLKNVIITGGEPLIQKDIMNDPITIIKTQKLALMITEELQKNGLEGIINIQIHKILNLA